MKATNICKWTWNLFSIDELVEGSEPRSIHQDKSKKPLKLQQAKLRTFRDMDDHI